MGTFEQNILLIVKIWPVLIGVLALVVWLVRLEMKVFFYHEKLKLFQEASVEQNKQLLKTIRELNQSVNTFSNNVSWLQGATNNKGES